MSQNNEIFDIFIHELQDIIEATPKKQFPTLKK